MFTPMKIPRTMNEKSAIIRAEEEDQRRRKTSVKREATVHRCLMGANSILPSIAEAQKTLPIAEAQSSSSVSAGLASTCFITIPSMSPTTSMFPMTPHAYPMESLPNDW